MDATGKLPALGKMDKNGGTIPKIVKYRGVTHATIGEQRKLQCESMIMSLQDWCPSGEKIIGVKVKFQEGIVGGDNTAMTGIEPWCHLF